MNGESTMWNAVASVNRRSLLKNSQTTYDPTLGHFNMQGYDEAQGVLIATNDGHTGGQMSSNLDNSMNIVAHNKYQSKVFQCHIIFK